MLGDKRLSLKLKSAFADYTQKKNKLDFLRNLSYPSITTFKPQRGDINIAWGSALGNPSSSPNGAILI
jgi:hypothetical protein